MFVLCRASFPAELLLFLNYEIISSGITSANPTKLSMVEELVADKKLII